MSTWAPFRVSSGGNIRWHSRGLEAKLEGSSKNVGPLKPWQEQQEFLVSTYCSNEVAKPTSKTCADNGETSVRTTFRLR